MKETIDLFEGKNIISSELVRDLRGLLNALQSADELWKKNLQTEINTLEMIYDSQNDGSISRWKEEAKDLGTNTIETIKNMASSYANNI
jgi:uncharacterized protein YbjQ (UPF0145 family)